MSFRPLSSGKNSRFTAACAIDAGFYTAVNGGGQLVLIVPSAGASQQAIATVAVGLKGKPITALYATRTLQPNRDTE